MGLVDSLTEAGMDPVQIEEIAKKYEAYLAENDPVAQIPLKDRYRVGPDGRILLDEPFLTYYRKEFTKAGMVLDNYRSSEEDFLHGLRQRNTARMEALETETEQRLTRESDPAMKQAIEASLRRDFPEALKKLEVAKRRKAFKAV